MAIRIATVSALALAAALLGGTAAKAQFFFNHYEMSAREIVDALSDDGYRVRGPMIRRGDVYVIDAVSFSGRSMRLIVSSRDGRVLDRYATDAPPRRYSDNDYDWRGPRPQRDLDDDDRPQQPPPHDQWGSQPQRDQYALGDLGSQPSRVYGNDSLFGPHSAAPAPTPGAAPESADTPKPKHHAAKKHHEPAVAKAAPGDTKAPTDAASPAPTPVATPSVAAVQPGAPAEPAKPAVTPEAKPIVAPTPQAVAPTPKPSQTTAETEKRPAVEAEKPAPAPTPKAEPARKKLNDLPVGTLD